MAQAANILPFKNCKSELPQPFDLEADLSDLAQMARIAYLAACTVLLRDVPEPGEIDRATFAVGHVEDMIKAMQRKYDFCA